MASITKAVIPVAGFGTRFLPVTKAQPKEMLPIIDKPVIQYIVEGAVASGITDIILITGASKRAIEDHFDYNFELQNHLKKQGKDAARKEVKKIADMANFIYIRQKGPKGNGDAVLCAKSAIGDEPFAVIWGDELWSCPNTPHVKQLIDVYEKYGDPVLTAKEITKEETNKYGVIDGVDVDKDVLEVKELIEKPGPEKAPSLIGSLGGYILTPDIFKELETTKAGKGGELWLVDALVQLMKKRPLYAKKIDGTYHDTGSKFGWLKATLEFAKNHPELKDNFNNLMDSICKQKK